MKPSFLNTNTPFITEMIQSRTAARAERKIRNAIADGATAIGLQVSFLPSGEITETTLRSLFAAAEGKPIYLTNYRQDRNTGRLDEELLNELLFALDCGGTLLDVMGDAFDPSPEELTRNEKAIAHDKLGKHMMHLVRLYLMCFDILERAEINTFREKEHDLLMKILNGEFLDNERQPIPEFYELVNTLQQRLEYAKSNTILPEKVDINKVNDFVVSVNEQICR